MCNPNRYNDGSFQAFRHDAKATDFGIDLSYPEFSRSTHLLPFSFDFRTKDSVSQDNTSSM